MQKRAQSKDTEGGRWGSSVGGHVTHGEEYEETAKREMKEELGIETNLERIGLIKTSRTLDFENIMFFKGNHEGPFELDKREVDFVQFFSIEEIKKMIERGDKITGGFLRAFKIITT